MKKLMLFLVVLVALSVGAYAQAPQGIPYQAVARNSSGAILASTTISVRFTIRDSVATGTIKYRETFSVTTTAQGMFSVNVGQGTPVTGTFSGINWGTNAKFMQVEMDPAGGTSYIDMGTQQMMSVPYALYAGEVNSLNTVLNNPDYVAAMSNVYLIDGATTYTVPFGKVAKISGVLPSSSVVSSNNFAIIINGVQIYIGGVVITQTGSTGGVFNNQFFTLNGDIWLPAGATILSGSNVLYTSVQEYSPVNFSVRLVSTSQTVPANKKWKISSVLPSSPISASNVYTIGINGQTAYIGGVAIGQTGSTGGVFNNQYFTLKGDIWLPAGSVLASGSSILGISVLEY